MKLQGITANLTIGDQLAKFMAQFQGHLKDQPALIDINNEEIIRWDLEKREKAIVTAEEFEKEAQLDEGIDASLAAAEIFQAGYLELCGVVFCLASVTIHGQCHLVKLIEKISSYRLTQIYP